MNSPYKNKYKSRRPRNILSPEERVAVIKRYLYLDESMKELAKRFNCSSGQVKNILRRREQYLSEKDKIEIKTEQFIFLTVGTIIAEFGQRLTARGIQLTYEMIFQKAKEAEDYIKTPVRTRLSVIRFLRRLEHTFYLTERSFRSSLSTEKEDKSKKSLEIIDIIKELIDSYDPKSTEPQLLRMRDMRKYFKHPPMDYSDDEDEDNCHLEIMKQTSLPSGISTFSDKTNAELKDNNANHEIINQQICRPNGISTSPCKIKNELGDGDDHEIVNKAYPSGMSISPSKNNVVLNGFDVENYWLAPIVNDIKDSQIKMGEGTNAVITANKLEAGIADTLTATTAGASGINVEKPESKLKSYEEALICLGLLEEFALLRGNIKATGLINQLENISTDEMKHEIN